MRRKLKKYFIPHKGNDFKPRSLRGVGIAVIALFVALSYLFSVVYTSVLPKTDIIATVFPSVLVDLTNQERLTYQASPLRINPLLEQAAQLKANDMARNSYFAHNSPQGFTPWYWFIQAGYTFTHAGENLAIDFYESEEVTYAWMNSQAHRDNILNSNFSEIGIATSRGFYQGRETTFVVQMFGSPSFAQEQADANVEIALANTSLEEVVSEESPEQDEMFIEVKVVSVQDGTEIDEESSGDFATLGVQALGLESLEDVQYASFLDRLVASPSTVLNYVYILLIALVLLSLLLSIFIEIKKQHPLHIIYGVLLLVMLVALVALNQSFFFSNIVIV